MLVLYFSSRNCLATLRLGLACLQRSSTPSWMISSLFELEKLLKAWNSSCGMPSEEDREDVINKQDTTRLSCATRISNSAQQDLSRFFQTLCPARYSPWFVTGICRELVLYIRIMYVKKFLGSSSIETIPMLFPSNQEYFHLQFL